jgi:nitrogen fixation NifU-like protein
MSRFSAEVADHFQSPRNRRAIPNPDRAGSASLEGHAPIVTVYLRLDGERVCEASYEAFGCGVTIACGSMLTELVQGLTLADCRRFSARQLMEALEGLPPDKEYCAHVVVVALHRAVGDA